jgi:hypothetical protein
VRRPMSPQRSDAADPRWRDTGVVSVALHLDAHKVVGEEDAHNSCVTAVRLLLRIASSRSDAASVPEVRSIDGRRLRTGNAIEYPGRERGARARWPVDAAGSEGNHAHVGAERVTFGRWLSSAPWTTARRAQSERSARLRTAPTGPTATRIFSFFSWGPDGSRTRSGESRPPSASRIG